VMDFMEKWVHEKMANADSTWVVVERKNEWVKVRMPVRPRKVNSGR